LTFIEASLAQPIDAIIEAMAAGPNREVWIGLVEVVPEEGNDIFDGAPGGYANVLAIAASVEDYMADRSGAPAPGRHRGRR